MIQKLPLLSYHVCNAVLLTLLSFPSQKAQRQEKRQTLLKNSLTLGNSTISVLKATAAPSGSDAHGESRAGQGALTTQQGCRLVLTTQRKQSTSYKNTGISPKSLKTLHFLFFIFELFFPHQQQGEHTQDLFEPTRVQ